MAQALDRLAEERDAESGLDLRAQGMIVGSVSLTAGFVSWMLRVGSLMASLISTKPAWSDFDPLPIFDDDEDEDSPNENKIV